MLVSVGDSRLRLQVLSLAHLLESSPQESDCFGLSSPPSPTASKHPRPVGRIELRLQNHPVDGCKRLRCAQQVNTAARSTSAPEVLLAGMPINRMLAQQQFSAACRLHVFTSSLLPPPLIRHHSSRRTWPARTCAANDDLGYLVFALFAALLWVLSQLLLPTIWLIPSLGQCRNKSTLDKGAEEAVLARGASFLPVSTLFFCRKSQP